MRDVKNKTEKPIMIHFSGHKVDNMHFVSLQSLVERTVLTGSW